MTFKKPSDEERALFRQAVREVRPLTDDGRVPSHHPPASLPARPRSRPRRGLSASAMRCNGDGDGAWLIPKALAITPKEHDKPLGVRANPEAAKHGLHKRLRKGKVRFTDQLDLHGKTVRAALTAAERFLEASLQDHTRCVLIISGKGRFSPHGAVLRPALECWLKDQKDHQRISDYCPACPCDGGDGAFYVLLTPP